MKLSRYIAHFLTDRKGLAAVEFALAIPILLILFLVGFEVSRYLLIHQKVDRVAYTVTDVVAQSSAVTNAQLAQIMTAATQIMDPYSFAGDGVVIISSVYRTGNNAPTVRWQTTGGGSLLRNSQIGVVNANATLPGGLVLNDRDNVIVAEVFFRFRPILNIGALSVQDVYKNAIFKPRLGALTTPPS